MQRTTNTASAVIIIFSGFFSFDIKNIANIKGNENNIVLCPVHK
jgi:hypothetical protein